VQKFQVDSKKLCYVVGYKDATESKCIKPEWNIKESPKKCMPGCQPKMTDLWEKCNSQSVGKKALEHAQEKYESCACITKEVMSMDEKSGAGMAAPSVLLAGAMVALLSVLFAQ
jgi:hypothetical protein